MRPEDVSCLETLVLSGEAVKQENVEVWASKVMLVNLYGPAEATACTVGRIPPVGWIPGTIGSMVGGVGWVCVPSNASQLAPVGTIGELVIEGAVVSRGYLNDRERTRASFLKGASLPTWLCRFRQGDRTQSRLYRPGDLVQYNADGTIRYIGRKDTQTKLRGQRIELGEVETWIYRNASLVVFIHEHRNYDEEGDEDAVSDDRPLFKKPIKAFRESAAVVETRLHEVIPRYMVPSLFIPVHEMPKTATGKMNRRLLREEASRLSREDILLYRVTRGSMGKVTTKTEEILQGIWARILSLPAKVIGVDDDFFGLGGDLISAMTLAAMARSQGLALTVADIFDNSALNKQAARTRSTSLFSINATPFSLVEVGESGNALLEPGIFYTVASANFTFYFVGNIDVGRLEQACASVFAKHEILRTLFISYRDTLVQVILRDIQCPFHHTADVEDLTTATKALYDQGAGRHITEVGLPLRYTLLSNLPQSQHIFSIRISHAQYDGVCLRLLCDQIQAAYNDLTKFASAPPETDFSSFCTTAVSRLTKKPRLLENIP
ncbi:Nonribosomal peptide synthetases (NRPS) [Aspergillus tanneri]|uniref:Nonribosomal peptide synthetases (NRPS) n=1 Tax=Aspergillus tanneri TaxID=1220188 RepID=A0A5M9MX37_9EURO|nr:Nonribosomal peptide synthetases (NRPS) [Aspergillus tanneri]KAA8649924.1 Nonribosomal peptide synthetases (NRPS) [Aspergillus tanneri]